MGARSTKIFTALFFIYFVFPSHSLAQEWVQPYKNARSLGMGGAEIGLTSDETSLYRNPANLGSIRGYFGSLLDPELEGQADFTNYITASNLSKATDIGTMAGILEKNPGEYYHARMQVTPSFTTRNFGFGLIYRNELNATVDATGTTMDTNYQNDLGAIVGANQSFFGGIVKIGASAKVVNRIEVVSATLATAGPFDLTSIAAEGTGIAYDAGLQIQLPVLYVPTISVVAHDLGNTKFNLKDGVRAHTSAEPQEVKQSVDAAISLFPIHSNRVRSTWTLEYDDVTNSRDDTDNAKRLHFGAEINFKDLFFLRFGYNQRYITEGIEISSERLAWQISSYGEDVGTEASPKEDRRYVTRFIIRY